MAGTDDTPSDAPIPDMLERGVTLHRQGDLAGARAAYLRILTRAPRHFDALQLLGAVTVQAGDCEEALALLDRAVAVDPGISVAHYNRGNALLMLRRPAEALASYDRTIALKADDADAHNNRGTALMALGRDPEALASYDRAVALKPRHAQAHYNRANLLADLGRPEEALAAYRTAMALKPGLDFLPGAVLHARMKICAWETLDNDLAALAEGLRAGRRVASPFVLIGALDSPALQKTAAEIYVAARCGDKVEAPVFAAATNGKIRIGYFSADFHDHATMHLMAKVFEAHDRARFDIYGFSFGPDRQDDMRRQVSRGFDAFFDVREAGDRAIASQARDLALDIAVDLKGHTQHARTGIFAARGAPVQAAYLGYPGTMGARFMDYVIADATVIPQTSCSDFTEKVVTLPHSYQMNDSERAISACVFTRASVGLPDQGFVFCSFNNSYKILPPVFDVWMRLLRAVEGSVLWLRGDVPAATANLRRAAAGRGVDGDRLVFAERLPQAEHLARQHLADLFLDTAPCCAHTTASDALWAGLPVLTCQGQSFTTRVAASLLKAVGLPELITDTLAGYEAMALSLARDGEQLARLRAKLAANRRTMPLFDTLLSTRHLEAAFTAMHLRRQAGLPPDHIVIPP